MVGMVPRIFWLSVSVSALPGGINFGDSSTQEKEVSVRAPSTGDQRHSTGQGECCCVPTHQACVDRFTEDDLVGEGLINERIVNRPGGGSTTLSCPVGNKVCCYPDSYDFQVFERTCVSPTTQLGSHGTHQNHHQAPRVPWSQGCHDTPAYGNPQCGTRNYREATGLEYAETSPGEFPWTCLLLNQNNDFIGTCVVIPDDFNNDSRGGTRKVLTAAHNLKKLGLRDQLKVRVGEYDASGYNPPESTKHEEYFSINILKHPQFDAKSLKNDIALITLSRNINLNHPYVNTACLPSCDHQFNHQFSNGTGVRCWVAGWGKNEFDGSFQFIQHKVDLPLVDDYQCSSALKQELNRKKAGAGDRWQLHPSQQCAGGEVGKDACTGDGGSPLVCQATSGRWTVVGLVSWGIGCATHVPGVYTKVANFRQWINDN